MLFGARISETIVINTYNEFKKRKLLSPAKIIQVGWDELVNVLDTGGYVRYDFKTATKLLEINKSLIEQYNGELNELYEQAKDSYELEIRLQNLGKGIGTITVNIFLRELRDIWEKANPLPQDLALLPAYRLGIIHTVGTTDNQRRQSLVALRTLWQSSGVVNKRFADFESALIRIGKNFCRPKKCNICVVTDYCKKR